MTKSSLLRVERRQIRTGVRESDVPELIWKTAQEIAGAFYEKNRSARFRQHWRDCDLYVEMNWAFFVPTAKDVLLGMLTLPEVDQEVKDGIYDCFTKNSEKKIAASQGGQLLN